MLTLYGSVNSSAGRCIWALEEAGISFVLQSVDLKKGEQKAPWFLALNPNGKIPVLVDGDFFLYESYAINWYVAEKYAPQLLLSTAEDRALVQQWTHWSGFHLQCHIETVMYFTFFSRGTLEAMEKAKNDLVPYLHVLDATLEKNEYILGSDFSLADINVGSVVNLGASLNLDYTPYVHISRWLLSLKARDAYARAIAR